MSELLNQFTLETLPPHCAALRQEVKDFLRAELGAIPADVRARSWMGLDAGFSRKLAKRGWVGLTLPKEYGGANMDTFSRFVLVEELLAAGAPVAAHWIADRQSGPQILKYGTEAQKREILPRICAGEAFFCIGMSEPNSGSDLASVRSRATPGEGGGWVLNGRKIWTTNAHHCHYMIALVRTSGGPEDRQKGLSQFLIDLKAPGVTVRPITDLTGDAHFNEVFFDNVQLADDALIGTEGAGWEQVNAELAFERSGPERIYSSMVLVERWLAHLRRHGSTPRDVEMAGRFAIHLATLRNLSISVTAKLAQGQSPVVEAALVKDIGTEFEQAIPQLLEASLNANPGATIDPDLYRALSWVTSLSPTFSLRGGTREILRGMIARGLGLR